MIASFYLLPSAFRTLPLPAFFGLGTHQFDRLGHFPTDFVLKNFAQRDIGRAEICRVVNQRTAQAAAARIQLADTARDKVDEDVRIADLFGSLLA